MIEVEHQNFAFQAQSVLNAHEPRYWNVNSTLHKEIWEASRQARAACHYVNVVEMLKCTFGATRPVWERNAPGTIRYYDEYMKKELEFARRFEASPAGEARLRAAEVYWVGMKQAIADYGANAQREKRAPEPHDAATRQQPLQIPPPIADIPLAVEKKKNGQHQNPISPA